MPVERIFLTSNSGGEGWEFEVPDTRPHWDCIDEYAPSDADYIRDTGSDQEQGAHWDRFNVENPHEADRGTTRIDSVKFYVRLYFANNQGIVGLRVSGIGGEYVLGSFDIGDAPTWTTLDVTRTLNPHDGEAWEWADIDNIVMVLKSMRTFTYQAASNLCSAIYIEVNYTVTDVTIDVPLASVSSAALVPALSLGVELSPPVAAVTSEALVPVLVLPDARVLAPLALVGSEALTPSILTTGDAVLDVPLALVSSEAPAPAVAVGVTLLPPLALASGAALVPTMSRDMVLSPPLALVDSRGLVPTTSSGHPLDDLVVRIAFNSDPYDAVPDWADVSPDLISFSIKRGRQHQLDRFEAGTAVLLLNNTNGNYWPNNEEGSYYPNVKLGKRVNIQVNYNGSVFDRYTGFVRKWKPSWLSIEGLLHPVMQLECVDLQRNIARAKLNDETGYAQEASGARVGHVLDDLDPPDGWPDRNIDTGDALILASGALANVDAMNHLFAVQESELGIFWMRGDGYAMFQERGARLEAPYDESQATFGDGGLPIFDPDLSLDDDLLFNEARLQRVGGEEQVWSDESSIADYGLRTLSKSGLLLTDDDIVFLYCLFFIARFQESKMRAKSITVIPQTPGYEEALWPIILGLDISSRVTLVRTEAGINTDYFIEGIEDSFDYRERLWRTKYQLSDASSYFYEPDSTEAALRPVANGDHIGLNYQFPVTGAHWEKVDEEDTDEDATYVQMNASAGYEGYDLYELEDLPTVKGVAEKITINVRMRRNGSEVHTSYPRIRIKTHGTLYGYQYVEPGSGWTTISQELTLNPFTGEAWTVEEINDLQVGPTCDPGTFDTKQVRCTQVWVDVVYTPGW